jgi:hypothetical protein
MKSKLSAIVFSAVATVALLSLGADSSGPKAGDAQAVSELRAQITQLRAEVDRLHQRTETLESTVEELKRTRIQIQPNPQPISGAPSSTPLIFTPSPNNTRSPKIWGEREVNGWTYYIVPCDERAR